MSSTQEIGPAQLLSLLPVSSGGRVPATEENRSETGGGGVRKKRGNVNSSRWQKATNREAIRSERQRARGEASIKIREETSGGSVTVAARLLAPSHSIINENLGGGGG